MTRLPAALRLAMHTGKHRLPIGNPVIQSDLQPAMPRDQMNVVRHYDITTDKPSHSVLPHGLQSQMHCLVGQLWDAVLDTDGHEYDGWTVIGDERPMNGPFASWSHGPMIQNDELWW